MRYYLEIHEDGHRLPIGRQVGYESLAEAQDAAKRAVDDALPRNTVHILADVGYAFLAGDGGEEIHMNKSDPMQRKAP